jgi:xylan 1,4-beta-xylosidase
MSGTYEELGVFPDVLGDGKPSYANLIQGIALPGFNAYKMLHALGHIQLAADGPALASRRADGSLAALVWNLAEATQPSGIPGVMNTRDVKGETKRLLVHLKGARGGAMVKVQFVDQTRGSPFPAWRKMGSPQYPTVAQVAALRKAADIAPPVTMRLSAAGTLALDLPPEGLALIRL